jgi:hypothetical protein
LRAKKGVPSEDAEDCESEDDMSNVDSKSYRPNARSEKEDETANEEDWGSDELVKRSNHIEQK